MIINPIMPIILLMVIWGVALWLVLLMPTKILKVLGIFAIILMAVVGLRPMLPNGEVVAFKNNVDVIFVMDGTLSMLAEDYDGNGRRIDAVVSDIQYIVKEIPGAYYSLIEFDNNSHINLRSTIDANAAVTAAKTTHKLDEFYARGTTLTVFKNDLAKILESSSKKEERKRIVFVMTDGENTSEQKMDNLESLRDYIDGGAVLGYGTQHGGKMKVRDKEDYYSYGDSYTDPEYLQDWSNWPPTIAISKIDETNLKKIASELGIEYIYMDKQSNVQPIIDNIKTFQNMEEGGEKYAYDDIYYYFCWPLVGILIAILYLMKKELL